MKEKLESKDKVPVTLRVKKNNLIRIPEYLSEDNKQKLIEKSKKIVENFEVQTEKIRRNPNR